MDLPPTSILCWRRLKNRQFSTKFGTFVPEWLQDLFFFLCTSCFFKLQIVLVTNLLLQILPWHKPFQMQNVSNRSEQKICRQIFLWPHLEEAKYDGTKFVPRDYKLSKNVLLSKIHTSNLHKITKLRTMVVNLTHKTHLIFFYNFQTFQLDLIVFQETRV